MNYNGRMIKAYPENLKKKKNIRRRHIQD